MRWSAFVILIGCARPSAPPLAPANVVPETTAPAAVAEDLEGLRGRADAAVTELATKLGAIQSSCREHWLEPEVACETSGLASLARDYQAYYGQREDPRHDSGRIDALPRLGGLHENVDDVTTRIATHCEDLCRSARLVTIDAAATAAVDQCAKGKAGLSACKAFARKLAPAVRASEVDRWSSVCEGRCENERIRARTAAEIARRRPRTRAQADACARACHAKHDGGWCGTDLMTCLGECSMTK
jgi:hypothetical protein